MNKGKTCSLKTLQLSLKTWLVGGAAHWFMREVEKKMCTEKVILYLSIQTHLQLIEKE